MSTTVTYKFEFTPWTNESPESQLMFVTLYNAFTGDETPNRAKTIEDTRNAIKILDALDAVSELVNAGTPREGRILKPEGGVVTLEESPYTLLRRNVDAHVASVPFNRARVAIKVKDLVDGAAKEVQKEARK